MSVTNACEFETVSIQVPKIDLKRLRGIVKAMGWKIEKRNALDESLDDIKNGRVKKYDSLEELVKDI